jgi:hypothetical protein
MTTPATFVNRLKKIGIQVELLGNHPWIYLHKVNGKKVKGQFRANHGYTVFFYPQPNQPWTLTDIGMIFNKIRETLKQAT